MHTIITALKSLADELIYIFFNYVISIIPIWLVRKFFYKLFGMKIGKGSRILMTTRVVSPWKIVIGEHSFINEGCFLDGRGGLYIGNNSMLAVGTKIITGSHDIYADNFTYTKEMTRIGDNCAIFAEAVVLPGVIMENKSVAAAGSVLPKGTYKENCVYGGNPAKLIKKRNLKNPYAQDSWKVYFR